ncbi:MAG: alpha/beta hydrolase [Acidobacteriota bacterium]
MTWLAKLRWPLAVVLVLYLGLATITYFVQRSVVWPRSLEEFVDRPVAPGAELVWMGEGDERVEGWFFPALGESDRPAPAVIYFHGNNELIDHCLEFAERYPRRGVAVLLPEYRGYGRSAGRPSREGVRADMIGFHDWLAAKPEVDASRIVFHGSSLGGAVAADLAGHREPAAMILTSTFTSLERMFWRFGIPGFLVKDRYRTEDVVRSVQVPTLIMHGRRDNVVPVAHGRALGAVGDHTTYLETDANHDLPLDWPRFEDQLLDFLATHGIVSKSAVADGESAS